MKSRLKIIVPVFLCFLSPFLSSALRWDGGPHRWKGWLLVYVVSGGISEEAAVSVLERNGAVGVISKGRLAAPEGLGHAPARARGSYLSARECFFSDETGAATVLYVPERFSSAARRAARELSAFRGTSAGTDGPSSFPWFCPAVALAFAAFCLLLTEKPRCFVLVALIHVFLAFSRPLASVSAGCCTGLAGFVLVLTTCDRDEFAETLRRSRAVIAFVALPFVLLLAVSPIDALLYLACVLSSASVVHLWRTVCAAALAGRAFGLVLIRSAPMVPLFGKKSVKLMLGLFSAVLLLLVRSLLLPAGGGRPALPAPAEAGGGGALPGFSDFTLWCWDAAVFPFRRLGDGGSAPGEGETVYLADYVEEGGRIRETRSPALTFGDGFRAAVEAAVASRDDGSFEKMLLAQGRDAEFRFSEIPGAARERFGTAALALFMLLPLACAGHCVQLGRKYGFSV